LFTPQNVEIIDQGYRKSGGKDVAVTILEFRIREERTRQIRRMCDVIEHPVICLKRVAFGPIRLDTRLSKGESRPLTNNEIKALKRGVGGSAVKTRSAIDAAAAGARGVAKAVATKAVADAKKRGGRGPKRTTTFSRGDAATTTAAEAARRTIVLAADAQFTARVSALKALTFDEIAVAPDNDQMRTE
jgi:hypothetical protein